MIAGTRDLTYPVKPVSTEGGVVVNVVVCVVIYDIVDIFWLQLFICAEYTLTVADIGIVVFIGTLWF